MKAQGSLWYVIGISLVAALGGFLFGFDMTVVSGTIPFLDKLFQLDEVSRGWAASSCILGCVFGAAAAGRLADALGRKKVLIATAVLFAFSAAGAGWCGSFTSFVAYRFLCGLAIGAASGVAPVYIAETAPTRLRGAFVSFYQLAICAGLAASYYSNYFLLATGDNAWRWMFTVAAVPAGLFFALLFLVPETPRWLVKSGREAEAARILTRVDGSAYAQQELAVIRETLATARRSSFRELLRPRIWQVVLIGSLLGVFSQISGANAIFIYAPKVFAATGAGLESSLFQSSLIGLVLIAFTFIPIFFVERVGRKPILILGVGCMATLLAVLWYLLSYAPQHGLLILAAILGCIAAYASSIACLTWVILSEIFPNRIRGEAMAVANFSLWTANFALLLSFPIIEKHYSIAAPFGGYAIVCTVIVLFVWKFIPETKGKSLEEIEIQLVGLPPQEEAFVTR